MKRIITILLLVFVVAVCSMAQQFKNESEYYPKSFQIEKIYSHSLGYRIDYIKQNYSLGTLWAPIEWFRTTAGRGWISYGKNQAYPYITIYFKNGQFDHFKLYLIESTAHRSWDILDSQGDYSEQFSSPDSIPEFDF